MKEGIGAVLAALYLRGLPRIGAPPRSRWRLVESALRRKKGTAAEVLASEGLWYEAGILGQQGLLESAASLVDSGRVVTAADSVYPQEWLTLKDSAPPALWQRGIPVPHGPRYTVVGSREIDAPVARLAFDVGRAIAESGGVVVSGGASGCDRAAAGGARDWAAEAGVPVPLVEVLPHGIAWGAEPLSPGCALSVAAPEEPFSTALAMERNTLLYAAGVRTLVVACRFRQGGTWTGASSALRRNIGSIWVWGDGSPGANALVALGAHPVSSIPDFLEGGASRSSLFA